MSLQTPFARAARLAGLCALVGLTASGCDLLEDSDLVSSVSSADLSDIEDILDGDLACSVDVESFTDSESGTLDDDDCTLNDDSFVDFYAFELDEDADVEIELESDDFPPYLAVYEVDLNDETLTEVAVDVNATDDDRAGIDERLDSGLYVVFANSVTTGQTGDYTLTIDADSDDSDDRPAARPAVTAKPFGAPKGA